MATQAEEQQTKEFLKRAEIRTMRKDLQVLREADALKERDKIAQVKTLEEQLQEAEKNLGSERQKVEKQRREEILSKGAVQEKEAEKNLKQYASEQERQQIFILESQRLSLDTSRKEIDEKKEPESKLQKNKLLIEKRAQEQKLTSITERAKKLQEEEGFITDKANKTTIQQERKSLEQRKWELDNEEQKTEKSRWQVEKQIADIEAKIKEIDRLSVSLVAERNDLSQKILGIEKSLRDIYSGVMTKEEEKRAGQLQEQKIAQDSLAKIKSEQKERIQREQWMGPAPVKPGSAGSVRTASELMREKMAKSAAAEQEQRKQFAQNVENWAEAPKK